MDLSSLTSSILFPIGELAGTDMHSHLVPGIDDGSPAVETSLLLIEGLVSIGYKKLITTPHIKTEFPNSKGSISGPFGLLKASLAGKGITIPISFAAEYMTDENFSPLISGNPLLTMGSAYLLMETGFQTCPENFWSDLEAVQRKGMLPVLAHPERYHYISDISEYDLFREKGMLFQVNILSFTGYYGEKPMQLAYNLLESGMIDLLGTDLHNIRQLAALKNFAVDRKTGRQLEKLTLLNKEL